MFSAQLRKDLKEAANGTVTLPAVRGLTQAKQALYRRNFQIWRARGPPHGTWPIAGSPSG